MIVREEELAIIREAHRQETIVFVHGVYDLFHYGHLASLAWAKQQGDRLVVGVSEDTRVARRKGPPRPIIPQAARLALVDALKVVDYTVLTEGDYNEHLPASVHTAHLLQPDIIILSDTCSPAEETAWRSALATSTNRIIRHPASLRLTSTSELIRHIKES